MINYLKRFFRAFVFWILPLRWFNKLYVEKNLYYKNPLYNHQKYKYRLCGCGSGQKVKWCCGKGKWIAFNQYQQFKRGLEMWEMND